MKKVTHNRYTPMFSFVKEVTVGKFVSKMTTSSDGIVFHLSQCIWSIWDRELNRMVPVDHFIQKIIARDEKTL